MIELSHVSRVYSSKAGPVRAVDDVSLTVARGEIFGIIGFSGAGKSTLVRCINLLERPTSGSVKVDGVELTALPEAELRLARRRIGMIFQHFHLMPSRTVENNVDMALAPTGMPRAQREKRVRDLLELVGLADQAKKYPSQLSGGQQQRVAIARALANDPKVLLCDEATSALDPRTTQSILRLLKDVNRKLGITVVLITHQMSVVKSVCDRCAVMEHGKVVEQGPILEIFAHPKEAVTRGFIDTASNVDDLHELLEASRAGRNPEECAPVYLLTYAGSSAGEPLMSELFRLFSVRANIIFGNIELLKGVPLGKLAVELLGEPGAVRRALDWIRGRGVDVEVL